MCRASIFGEHDLLGPAARLPRECRLRECHTLRAGRHVGLAVLVTKGSPSISLWLLGRVRADCSNALRGAFKGWLPGLLDKLWYTYPWQVVISCGARRVLKDVSTSLSRVTIAVICGPVQPTPLLSVILDVSVSAPLCVRRPQAGDGFSNAKSAA